jgi:hypothetical protein
MFNSSQLLDIQVRTLQSYIPETCDYRGKQKKLTKKEKLATGRAIWFVVKKGYGISTATMRASGSFGVSCNRIEKIVREVFPEEYFTHLQESKNKQTVKHLLEK